jgi:hypothetical protein
MYDETDLAARMIEMAKADMNYVRSKESWGNNPSWGKVEEYEKKQKQGGRLGRPNGFKTKINERLEKGMTAAEIVAELNCSRNIVNQYRRKRRLEQNAASSHAA